MSHVYWPQCGADLLTPNEDGHLLVSDDFLRALLDRPELALVAESCAAEIALHEALTEQPRRVVDESMLTGLADKDVADNYRVWLRFRQRLLAHPTLEASYLALFDGVDVPPLLVAQLTQVLLRHILGPRASALQVRAAEMLFRTQKISVNADGAVMAADHETVERLAVQTGFGSLGQLLRDGGIALRSVDLDVLGDDNADDYWSRSEAHDWVLALNRDQPAMQALCEVLTLWIEHFLGVQVEIKTEGQIVDAHWVWHVGLDAQASSVLNDLYQDIAVDDERLSRMLCLFTLRFQNPEDMLAQVRGKPVYLAMAMDSHQHLRLKPQNLLLNLPLVQPS